jgi:Tropinone reductase 1
MHLLDIPSYVSTLSSPNRNMQKTWSLLGKKALITGGTKGIGLAIAEEFLMHGAEVFIVARTECRCSKSSESVWRRHRWKVHGLALSIEQREAQVALTEAIKTLWGRFDILVNNVGTNVRKATLATRMKKSAG